MTPQPRNDGADSPFDMRESSQGDVTILTLTGACTMNHATALGDKIMDVARSPAKLVILDLTDLDFIESTNLGKIVAGYLHLRKRRGDLRVVSPQPRIRQLLDLTRLSTLFGVFDSIPDAVGQSPN